MAYNGEAPPDDRPEPHDHPFTCGGCFAGYDDIEAARACCPEYATLAKSGAFDGESEDDRPPALTKTYGRSVFDPRWGDGEPRYPDEYDAHAQAEVRGRVKRRLTTVGGRL